MFQASLALGPRASRPPNVRLHVSRLLLKVTLALRALGGRDARGPGA